MRTAARLVLREFRNMNTRILLADDQQMMREGLRLLIEKQQEMDVIAEAVNAEKAVELARELSPDVVIMHVHVPVLGYIRAVRQMVRNDPAVKVVALSMHSNEQVVAGMLEAGARGYVLIESAFGELVQGIKEVTENRRYVSPKLAKMVLEGSFADRPITRLSTLSARELEAFELLAQGGDLEEIASILGLRVKTLRHHQHRIMAKLGLRKATDLVRFAFREGLV